MKLFFLALCLLSLVGCTTTPKVAPEVEAKPDAVQREIDSLQTQITSIDALIENTRTHVEGYSLADMAKHDLTLKSAETEIESYRAERQILEARLLELQVSELSTMDY